jgi:hypothetical protein
LQEVVDVPATVSRQFGTVIFKLNTIDPNARSDSEFEVQITQLATPFMRYANFIDLEKLFQVKPRLTPIGEFFRESHAGARKVMRFAADNYVPWQHLIKPNRSTRVTKVPAHFETNTWQCSILFWLMLLANGVHQRNSDAVVLMWTFSMLQVWFDLLRGSSFTLHVSQHPPLQIVVTNGQVVSSEAWLLFTFFGCKDMWLDNCNAGVRLPELRNDSSTIRLECFVFVMFTGHCMNAAIKLAVTGILQQVRISE